MTEPEYVHLYSEYRDNFDKAFEGKQVLRKEIEIERNKLAMMIKKDNKFNQTQGLALIEYKRLYERQVVWMWYIRFRLYGEKERKAIHKWKCLDLTNSYQLFSMIIQNKKQRKNARRREAIINGIYVDPFDYYAAREYLEEEFLKLRNKK